MDGEAIGDPLVVANMQNKFGLSLMGLGEPDRAIVLLQKARETRKDNLGPGPSRHTPKHGHHGLGLRVGWKNRFCPRAI